MKSACVGVLSIIEHFREFKLSSSKSNFAKDLLDNGQSMCPIENFINILHIKKRMKTYKHPGKIPHLH